MHNTSEAEECGGITPVGAAAEGHHRFRRSSDVGISSSFVLLFFLLGLIVLFAPALVSQFYGVVAILI